MASVDRTRVEEWNHRVGAAHILPTHDLLVHTLRASIINALASLQRHHAQLVEVQVDSDCWRRRKSAAAAAQRRRTDLVDLTYTMD